jgi:hypothetical protein
MPFIKRIIAARECHWAAAVLFKQIFCIHSVGFGVPRLGDYSRDAVRAKTPSTK